jgi:peptidyl-prolyl cis-trans isomerase D
MLQKFGEHIRGWFAGIVIAVIAVAFVAWGLEYYIDRGGADTEAIAVVNGQKIPGSVLTQQYQQAQRQQEKALGRGLSEQEMTSLKEMTLNQIISKTIMVQAAKKQGFSINLNQIKNYIEQVPQFQSDGKFNPQLLQNMLYNMGYQSPDQFFEMYRDEQLVQQMVNGVRGSAFVIPSEVSAVYGLWQQHRDFSFAILPITKLESSVQVTPQQIQSYYTANKKDFMIPAKVQLQYIQLSRDALMKNVKVTDEDVQSYYDSNKANFTVPPSWKITRVSTPNKKQMNQIVADLKKGKKLSDIAKESHKGWQAVTQTISAVDVAPALAEVFNGLKPGQVSKPLPTPGGLTIFELLENTPQHTRPLAQAKDQIKKMLISQQVDQAASQKSEQLSSVVFTNPTSLDVASKQTGLPIQTSPMMTQKGLKTGVFAQQQVLNAAFSDGVLKQGNNSNPISLKDGGVVVLRVLKSTPASEKPLAQVQAQIVAAIKKQTALREAGLQAYTMQTQLEKGHPVTSLHWQQRKNATRSEPTTNKQILNTAFMTAVGKYKTVELDNGYAIVKVNAIHNANWDSATAKQKEGLVANLAGMRGANEFQVYVHELFKSAKVEIKDKTLASSWSI